jgi:4'-phosphopantetheinyl transferase
MTDPHITPVTAQTLIPGIQVQYHRIDLLAEKVFTRPLANAYATRPARRFSSEDFTACFFSRAEMEQINRFKVLKKQIEWISGRVLVKSMVHGILMKDTLLSRITLAYEPMGAPFIEHSPAIPLSLSHSREYTAAALGTAPGTNLGLDLEKINSRPDPYFMETAFSRRERADLAWADTETIYRHWTLKEAFLKYIKMGFNESLHQVEILDNAVWYRSQKQDLTLWSELVDQQYWLTVVAGPAAPAIP